MQHSLIITPNRRLAAFLQRTTGREKLANSTAVVSDQIMPIDAWLLQLWDQALYLFPHKTKPILNPAAQLALISQIIANSNVGVELLRIDQTAKSVLQAWGFLCQWQVALTRVEAYISYSPDCAAFYSWIKQYLNWLDANKFTDFYLMQETLVNLVPDLASYLPAQIILHGITNMSPQHDALFKLLAESNVDLISQNSLNQNAKNLRTQYNSIEQELRNCALWAANEINNSAAIIGVVVPNLEQKRELVEDLFNSYIPAEKLNISAPMPISNFPLIDTAFLILQLARSEFNYDDFSIILRSPFISGGVASAQQRAVIDRKLREQVEYRLNWSQLKKILSNYDQNLVAIIDKFAASFADDAIEYNSKQWAVYFNHLLQIWGWPGKTQLSKTELDLFSCWSDLLDSYLKLDIIIGQHNFPAAINTLRNLALQTPFAAAETGQTQVHILGMLEADGILFDKLWVTGMDRDNWPPVSEPNPFIPIELQRQFELPKSSPSRELQVATRLTANLKHGAKNTVIFSYAETIDNAKTAVSNLIYNLAQTEILLEPTMINTNNLECFEDNNNKPLKEAQISGGTSILKLQAQCPFKANAEIRLKAKELIQPSLFLTPLERGNIVHEVLEAFWKICETQEQLSSWYPETARQKLNTIISQVLAVASSKLPNILNAKYIELEQQRLEDLLMRWLEFELKREEFTILKLEQKDKFNIGPLSINMRTDRIDQLQDNSILIIDYKTGRVQVSDWFTDPIQEPQLPLYAISNSNLAGVYVAIIRDDELKMTGVAKDKLGEVLPIWQQNLRNTAYQFADGLAIVAPYSAQICANCKLQTLCRIYDN